MSDGIRPQVCVPGNIYGVSCLNQIIIVLLDLLVQFVQTRRRDEMENAGLIINIACPPPGSAIKLSIQLVYSMTQIFAPLKKLILFFDYKGVFFETLERRLDLVNRGVDSVGSSHDLQSLF